MANYYIDQQTRQVTLGNSKHKMRVVIAGFSAQKLVSPDQVLEALSELPLAHVEKIRAIVYEPRSDFIYPHLAKPANQLGEYDRATHTISIQHIKSLKEFRHTLFHEIGHGVFLHVLSVDDRYFWTNELHGREGFVTPYARTNPSEDFAESYAIFCTEQQTLARLPKKFRFLNERVFRNIFRC